ncbi:MAG: hypothetical protein WA996_25310 [Candidatus Promineifilaceae bacterium]
MYCQYCGEMIKENGANKCQACGREVILLTRGFPWRALFLMIVLALAVVAIYMWRQPAAATDVTQSDRSGFDSGAESRNTSVAPVVIQGDSEILEPENTAAASQISHSGGYQLPVSFGDMGSQLLAAGAIDYDRFVQTYKQAGQALNEDQLAILENGSDAPVVVNQDNAYFLLNLLWALGLTNQNQLLDEGPLMQYSEGDIGRFASTGGWSIGTRPATELYSSTPLISLTSEEQTLLEKVAYNVYRPCCNNHTAFADCNHGMAMLGLLELMAGQGASEGEMFEAAKNVSSFWFPQQALETAVFFQSAMGLDPDEVDGRMAVGPEVFSGSGFRTVHEWLASNEQLEEAPNSGGSCGV